MQTNKSTEKKRILLEIFLSMMVLVFAIALIIFIGLIRSKRPNKRSEYKLTDISIMGLELFDFIKNKTIPEYPYDNLGITGKLILDCYTGTCIHEILRVYDDETCDSKGCSHTYYRRIEKRPVIEDNCSEQCYETGNTECNCSEPYNKIGTCENKTNDEYKEGKVCYAYNTIYFWKGKKYINRKTNNYSYLYDDIILENEECGEGTKNCGIIDDNGNELCIKSQLNCPINYISENILSNYSSSVLIGNKTFYYGNDNSTKRKIIAGLIVDTDLLLNRDNNKKDIIDDYTISGLLEDNQNLYKDVNLGYDPYKISDIDKKGKSYLRIFYNDQKVNLSSLREDKNQLLFNLRMNQKAFNSIHYNTNVILILGIIALCYLIIAFTIILILQTRYYKRGEYGDCTKCSYGFIIIIFLILFIFPLIFSFINISKAKDAEHLDPNEDCSTFKKYNMSFIILGFTLFLYLNIYIVFLPIKFCFKTTLDKKPISDATSATINNIK